MRRWSTITGHTEFGPAVFIQLETGNEIISVPVLFRNLIANQTYADRVRGIIEYLNWRADQIETIRMDLERNL